MMKYSGWTGLAYPADSESMQRVNFYHCNTCNSTVKRTNGKERTTKFCGVRINYNPNLGLPFNKY